MSVAFAPLGDVLADVRPGFASGDDLTDGVFQIRMNNITREGALILDRRRRVSPDSKQVARSLLEPGDVLFNATNSPDLVGKTAYFPGCDEPAVFSNHFLRLRPSQGRLDSRYLARWFQSEFQLGYFRANCKQWVNQATFGQDRLVAMSIPLPPIEEQWRIAEVLDAADGLRTKRRQVLNNLDTLSQAIFVDMFGDPVSTTSGRRTSVGAVAQVVTGSTPSRADPENYGDAIEWLKSDNILKSGRIGHATEMLSEKGRRLGREAPPGASLVVCIAGSPQSIGRVGLLDRQAAFNQQINAIIPGEDLLPDFLFHQLKVGQRLVQRASTNSMKGMVSKSAFCDVELLVPPLECQAKFVSAVKASSPVMSALQSSLELLDDLFASLKQRAFLGEL